jgi:hypothetical protein
MCRDVESRAVLRALRKKPLNETYGAPDQLPKVSGGGGMGPGGTGGTGFPEESGGGTGGAGGGTGFGAVSGGIGAGGRLGFMLSLGWPGPASAATGVVGIGASLEQAAIRAAAARDTINGKRILYLRVLAPWYP